MLEVFNSLSELMAYGIGTAYEDDDHYYLFARDPERDKYDHTFYLYNKKTKIIEWKPSIIDYFPQLDKAKKINPKTIESV